MHSVLYDIYAPCNIHYSKTSYLVRNSNIKFQKKLKKILFTICNSLYAFHYMGGTSQDVKRLKKWDFLPQYFGFFLSIHIVFALLKINMCFKHLEASHIMPFDS